MGNNIQKSDALKTILLTGFIVGTVDGAAAIINYVIRSGKNPVRIFNFIASGVFGTDAFSGGLPMAALGLLFHFIIAYAFTIFFFLIYPGINFFSKNIVLAGILYGLFIWLVMNLIVLPMSNTPEIPFNLMQAIIGIIILIICAGIPIAVMIHKHYQRIGTRRP